jgi:transcriptional regulator with XRE-family HTH domain
MEFIPVKCRIPDLERELKLEPYQVYDALNMSKQQYSAYRTNRRIPHLTTAKLLADFFGVPVDDLHVWKKVSVSRNRGRQKTD